MKAYRIRSIVVERTQAIAWAAFSSGTILACNITQSVYYYRPVVQH